MLNRIRISKKRRKVIQVCIDEYLYSIIQELALTKKWTISSIIYWIIASKIKEIQNGTRAEAGTNTGTDTGTNK